VSSAEPAPRPPRPRRPTARCGRIATRHLLEHGRRRIAYLAGRLLSASDQGRRRGYVAALQSAGIDLDARLLVELAERASARPWPDYDLGYDQCLQLLSREVPFDAILAYSDAIAIGALRALHDKTTLVVPDDLGLVGFDGLAIGQYMVPKLTSVGVPWYRVALAALEALIDLMADDGGPGVQSFRPELVPGESVARR
jgi:DNA-binding LacI/PurR family transcriptional regulator